MQYVRAVNGSLNGTVRIVTTLWDGQPGNHGFILCRGKKFLSPPSMHTILGAHQPPIQQIMGGGVGVFSCGEVAGV